jgi:acyl-ACP thioesterase
MYTFDSRIRYTELNHRTMTLDPSSIINYFQDCSTFQSEDLNLGLAYLQEKNRIWLMTSWQLQILKPASLGEYVTVGTWPYAFKGFYGYRNFILKNRAGELLAIADSIWAHLDTQTGTPIRVSEEQSGYVLEPPYPMEHTDRKIKLPEELTPCDPFPVIKSNIDSYNHVNNGQYIKMAEEFLPEDFTVSVMRVEYRKQAVLGDMIYPMISYHESCCCIALSDEAGKPYAIVEFIH